MADCVFCKIVSGEIPSDFLAETENVIAVYDIKPSAGVHILVIPKAHIETFLDIKKSHKGFLSEMTEVAQKIIKDKKITKGYKMIFNGGKYQFVPHLHWHVMGGKMKKLPH